MKVRTQTALILVTILVSFVGAPGVAQAGDTCAEECPELKSLLPECYPEGALEGSCFIDPQSLQGVPPFFFPTRWFCVGRPAQVLLPKLRGLVIDRFFNDRKFCEAVMGTELKIQEDLIFPDPWFDGLCDDRTTVACVADFTLGGGAGGVSIGFSFITSIRVLAVPRRKNECHPDSPDFHLRAEDCCEKYDCVSCGGPNTYPSAQDCNNNCIDPFKECQPVNGGSCYKCADPCPGDDLFLYEGECLTACQPKNAKGECREVPRASGVGVCYECLEIPLTPPPGEGPNGGVLNPPTPPGPTLLPIPGLPGLVMGGRGGDEKLQQDVDDWMNCVAIEQEVWCKNEVTGTWEVVPN